MEDLPGLWSNNSSCASLHDPLPSTTSGSTPHQPYDYDNQSTSAGISDISVSNILEVYKHDTELLKHILRAKAEEDKRRAAEEIRRTEEARLQSKYLDLGYEQHRRFSDPSTFTNEFLSGSLGSLAVSSAEVVPDWLTFNPDDTLNMLPTSSPMVVSLSQFDQTPPSPTTSCYRRPSPFRTSFDAPFADLTLSSASSPEPSDSTNRSIQGYNSVTTIATVSSSSLPSATFSAIETEPCQDNPPQPSTYRSQAAAPPPLPRHDPTTADDSPSIKSACKRTLSRTRSQRRPVIAPGKKKNRSLPLFSHDPDTPSTLNGPLDHGTVMEALRAKLRRSSHPPPVSDDTQVSSANHQLIWPDPQPMSPQGMLLLDLKNPRKVFPTSKKRTAINPRLAVVRRPKPFTSAHNHCDKSKDPTPPYAVPIK